MATKGGGYKGVFVGVCRKKIEGRKDQKRREKRTLA
jgi:hypothetical protein